MNYRKKYFKYLTKYLLLGGSGDQAYRTLKILVEDVIPNIPPEEYCETGDLTNCGSLTNFFAREILGKTVSEEETPLPDSGELVADEEHLNLLFLTVSPVGSGVDTQFNHHFILAFSGANVFLLQSWVGQFEPEIEDISSEFPFIISTLRERNWNPKWSLLYGEFFQQYQVDEEELIRRLFKMLEERRSEIQVKWALEKTSIGTILDKTIALCDKVINKI